MHNYKVRLLSEIGQIGGVAIGAACGGVARLLLTQSIDQLGVRKFPYGTLMVNLFGCFAIGLISRLSETKLNFGPNIKIFLMAGVCGGFTTLSAVMLDTATFIKQGDMMRAGANLLATIAMGFLSFRVGEGLAKII